MDFNKYPIILFDSECVLCTRFSQAISLIDKEDFFLLEPLQSDWLYKKHDFLNKESCKEELHVLINDKEFLKGGDAVNYIIQKLPGANKVMWLIEKQSTKKALNLFYKQVNKVKNSKRICKSCKGH